MYDILEKILLNKKPRVTLQEIKSNSTLLSWMVKQTKFLNSDAHIFERCYCIVNNVKTKQICKFCGALLKFRSYESGYNITCGNRECITKVLKESMHIFPFQNKEVQSKIRKTFRDKYNVTAPAQLEHVKEKMKNTMLQKYGTEYFLQSEVGKQKIEATILQKYGASNVYASDYGKQKIKQSNLEKYGVEYSAQVDFVKKKIRKTYKDRYWTKFIMMLDKKDIIPLFTKDFYINNIEYNFKCRKCNKEFVSLSHSYQTIRCPDCFVHSISIEEKNICNILQNIGFYIIENSRRVIAPKELDIYLPDYKLAIEYNGIYWHSELYGPSEHMLEKTNLCKAQGIQLLHVFENEWLEKQDIVKSIILAKLGKFETRIPARKCKVRHLTNNEYEIFSLANHIQGYTPASLKLGLEYNDQIVSIMSFGKSRFKKDETELLRYCALLNTQVIGGFSKLLKASQLDNIVTYCDLRYSDGSGYLKNGFEIIGQSKPNYWYFKGIGLESRIKYQKHKLPKLLENFDPKLSEVDNMHKHGYLRIFDCGNLKLQYRIG